MKFGHSKHEKALRHYEQQATEARILTRNDEADRVAAEERLHDHGLRVVASSHGPFDIEVDSRQATAAQLREIADVLDPPDELRIVRITTTAKGITLSADAFRLKQDETMAVAHLPIVDDYGNPVVIRIGWS